jgi:hypothetical protein
MYIGNSPGLSQRIVWNFVATEAQTVFTGQDQNNLTLNYTDYVIDVFVNGVLVTNVTDYTTTTGSTITFTEGLAADDLVTVVGVGLFNLADTYTRNEIDSFAKQKIFWRFIATEDQTVFTGTDENSKTLDFTGFEVDVFVNGNLLTPVADFTTTTSNTVTIAIGLSLNDEVLIKV